MIEKLRFQVSREFGFEGFSITAGFKQDGRLNILGPAPVRQLDRAECVVDPFLMLSEDSAQILFDELYAAGLRPSVRVREKEIVRDQHVDDMRKIAFHLLGIQADSTKPGWSPS